MKWSTALCLPAVIAAMGCAANVPAESEEVAVGTEQGAYDLTVDFGDARGFARQDAAGNSRAILVSADLKTVYGAVAYNASQRTMTASEAGRSGTLANQPAPPLAAEIELAHKMHLDVVAMATAPTPSAKRMADPESTLVPAEATPVDYPQESIESAEQITLDPSVPAEARTRPPGSCANTAACTSVGCTSDCTSIGYCNGIGGHSSCCATHDVCYINNDCSASSWWAPWPWTSNACDRCNMNAVGCFL